MRDTPGLLPTPTNQSQRPYYMQFLTLTHYPTHGFVYASEPAESNPVTAPNPNAAPQGSPDAMVMTTVPLHSYNTLFQHFTYACQPFWCHRLTVAVPGGVVYDVGDFRVRLGDVRQTVPTARVRGTLIEIEWRGPSVVEALFSATAPTATASAAQEGHASSGGTEDTDSGIDISLSAIEEADVDAEYAATAALIREFWARIGVDGAKEAIVVPGIGKEVKERMQRQRGRAGKSDHSEEAVSAGIGGVSLDEDPDPHAGVDVARQYMEVLRFNR